jgi:SAM-dependent methyltransferase
LNNQKLGYTGLDILEALESATNYNTLLVDLIVHSANGRNTMLDFGAGLGTFSRLLRKRGSNVICLEPDPYLADGLVRHGFATHQDLTAIRDNSLDFIFSLNVLEHIEDDLAVLTALKRKLKTGGRLLVYVPAFHCLWTSLDNKLKHFRRYRRRQLEQLAQAAGLFVCTSRYVDTLGFLAAFTFKLIARERDLTLQEIRFYDRYVIPPSISLDYLFRRFLGKNVYILCEKK